MDVTDIHYFLGVACLLVLVVLWFVLLNPRDSAKAAFIIGAGAGGMLMSHVGYPTTLARLAILILSALAAITIESILFHFIRRLRSRRRP